MMMKKTTTAVLLLVSLCIAAAEVAAQEVIVGFNPPPAATALEWFSHPTTSDTHRDGSHVLTSVFADHQRFSRAYVDSLLVGLEQIALTSDDESLRTRATSKLVGTASDRYGMVPIPGAMQRIRRIYRQTSDPAVRSLIVASLSRVADRTAAVAWLREIARQGPKTEDFPDAAHQAITTLIATGEEGRAVLRELHRNRASLPDPKVRVDLEVLAAEDFPVVDSREQNREFMRERERSRTHRGERTPHR